MFIHDDNALTKNGLTKLIKLISKEKIKFAFSSHAVKAGDRGYHFTNDILDRKGKRDKSYNFFKSLLTSIVKKHNLKIKKIHRMAVNITFNNGFIKEVPLHLDHEFPHKQVILYLNDSTGTTDIPFYNKSITPKKNTAIIFDDKYHKHYFPDYGVRVVCVFTFS